jgi:hypothetical protein
MAAGAAGRSPAAAVAFDQRLWRHQARSAVARIAAPGAAPLTLADGEIVTGAVIRAVGLPARDLARLPYQRLRSHQVVIGGTGTGKTTLVPLLTTPLPRLAAPRCRPGTSACVTPCLPSAL